MTPAPTDNSRQDRWQVRRQHDVTWRAWDGEVVIYDDSSGDTMKLDIIMSEIFRFMLHGPATRSEIVRHLASAFDLEADGQLGHVTAVALHRLRAAALIQATSPVVPAQVR